MTIRNKKETLILFAGDMALFCAALWFALAIRGRGTPSGAALAAHLPPFLILFAAWALVFFIAGLYGKHTLLLRSRLPTTLLHAQIANSALAVAFFYFIPFFGITPKVVLFIYLAVASFLIFLWRLYGREALGFRRREAALLIGSGEEMRELKREVNDSARYRLRFVSSFDLDAIGAIDFQKEIIERVYGEEISVIVLDLVNPRVGPILPHLYNLIFSRVRFVDMHKVYEDIFDRVPLSLLHENWFLENISLAPKFVYDSFKRVMDMALAALLGALSLPLYPAVFAAMKADDRGPLFVNQERVGQGGRLVRLVKFRTMTYNDGGVWGDANHNRVTRVGAFLRKTRIDELPQLWNVLRGDLSLVGPRPEFPQAVAAYERQVPFYSVRHLIKPGLSGWAQIHHERHPHHALDVRETRVKLSYDLYYIKNRSFMLDLKIALKTVKTLLSRSGA